MKERQTKHLWKSSFKRHRFSASAPQRLLPDARWLPDPTSGTARPHDATDPSAQPPPPAAPLWPAAAHLPPLPGPRHAPCPAARRRAPGRNRGGGDGYSLGGRIDGPPCAPRGRARREERPGRAAAPRVAPPAAADGRCRPVPPRQRGRHLLPPWPRRTRAARSEGRAAEARAELGAAGWGWAAAGGGAARGSGSRPPRVRVSRVCTTKETKVSDRCKIKPILHVEETVKVRGCSPPCWSAEKCVISRTENQQLQENGIKLELFWEAVAV